MIGKTTAWSKNPLHYLYGLIWLSLFVVLALYIFSGKLFMPDSNGNIHIVAILIGWIAEYLMQTGTGILVVLIGLYVAFKTITVHTK